MVLVGRDRRQGLGLDGRLPGLIGYAALDPAVLGLCVQPGEHAGGLVAEVPDGRETGVARVHLATLDLEHGGGVGFHFAAHPADVAGMQQPGHALDVVETALDSALLAAGPSVNHFKAKLGDAAQELFLLFFAHAGQGLPGDGPGLPDAALQADPAAGHAVLVEQPAHEAQDVLGPVSVAGAADQLDAKPFSAAQVLGHEALPAEGHAKLLEQRVGFAVAGGHALGNFKPKRLVPAHVVELPPVPGLDFALGTVGHDLEGATARELAGVGPGLFPEVLGPGFWRDAGGSVQRGRVVGPVHGAGQHVVAHMVGAARILGEHANAKVHGAGFQHVAAQGGGFRVVQSELRAPPAALPAPQAVAAGFLVAVDPPLERSRGHPGRLRTPAKLGALAHLPQGGFDNDFHGLRRVRHGRRSMGG